MRVEENGLVGLGAPEGKTNRKSMQRCMRFMSFETWRAARGRAYDSCTVKNVGAGGLWGHAREGS